MAEKESEMAVLAEHLDIFDGRKVICWTACLDSLVIYKFLGFWGTQA